MSKQKAAKDSLSLAQHKAPRKKPWRLIVNTLILLALGYIVFSQWSEFSGSLHRISAANIWLAGVGLLCILSTYCFAAFQYKNLALKRIPYWPTALIQLAGALVNRILPAGIGGIGLNIAYLKKRRHSIGDASIVAGTNNLLGIIMHVLLLGGIVLTSGSILNLSLPVIPVWLILVASLAIALIAASIVLSRRLRRMLKTGWRHIIKALHSYRKRPLRLLLAALAALCVSACFIAALAFSAWALGHNSFTFQQAALVMTLGVVAATVTPTPGGVVGAEAGLATGLVAYGFAAEEAIAVAILYRIISYWIPLAIGGGAFVAAQRKRYI